MLQTYEEIIKPWRDSQCYNGYYYSFEATGVKEIDEILLTLAKAGKAYHHTEDWNEPLYGSLLSPVDLIQQAVNSAAKTMKELRDDKSSN